MKNDHLCRAGHEKDQWGRCECDDAGKAVTPARTSTALPLAHPAAPQGEHVYSRYDHPDYPSEFDEPGRMGEDDAEAGWVEVPLYAALAPAAIASGREGAE